MGARGPAPKPTALRVLEGNPGKRPLSKDEPKPKLGIPKCPGWLELEAKREWKRIAVELERVGLLTVVDGAALAGYCQAYARWRQAEEIITRDGLTFETPNGYVQQRPEVSIAQKSLSLVKGFCSEFGLTPSARARMTVSEKGDGEEESPFDI